MATRDYTNIYSIKDYAINEVAPKFFDMEDINLLNVGLVGYSTELMANMTEDTFNSISTYIREIFPNLAQIPETLYNHAAMLQIDDLFATPAEMAMVIFVNEEDIIRYGVTNNNRFVFTLDSDLIVDIEGKQFMLDYDILVSAKQYATDYIFTASYDFSFQNTLSTTNIPYIKTKRIKLNGSNYLGLLVKVHQVNKFEQVEQIYNNDRINLPKMSFQFNDQLAGFEVFYKAPESTEYIQLTKKIFGSPPLRDPFCFYRFKSDDIVEISFTLRDNYFQPKFNSELLIKYYTTTGKTGSFPLYKGNSVQVIPKSEVHQYNNSIILYGIPQTESTGGKDKLSLEELRSIIIERSSTSGAYNVENDLQLYFSNYTQRDKNQVLFVKKRDDVLERLFSAFALFKDNNNDYYPTNTLNMNLYPTDFDLEYEQSNKFILKAGRLFKYASGSSDAVEMIPDKSISDNLSTINEEFIFTNPFLITVSKTPSIVGFYLNSVDDKIPLEYTYVNGDSVMQFICNTITISRNSLHGEDEYRMEVTVLPTSDLEFPLVDSNNVDLQNLKLMLAIEEAGAETCYLDFSLKSADVDASLYTFETNLTTDDYMTFGQRMRVLNVKNTDTGVEEVKLIPMSECSLNIYAFYKYSDMKLDHKFDNLIDYQPYSLTNIYSTTERKANFIVPMDIMRSRVKYHPHMITDPTTQEEIESYYMGVSFVPLVKAATMKLPEQFSFFLNSLYSQYNYLIKAIDKITNNYGIDLKFYNTYGHSKNFVRGEEGQILDKVNMTIRFKISPNVGVVEEELVRDLKIFIKDYIEGINNKGYNSIYISNLTQAIENSFPDVKYLKFAGINQYDTSVQAIENRGLNITLLTKEERKDYVPEYLTIGLADIVIDIIRN